MADLLLSPKSTALVLIDLQRGILARKTTPYSTADVVAQARTLVDAFHAAKAPVVFVHVDLANMLQLPADEPMAAPKDLPANACEIVPEAGMRDGDLSITKRHWGAFAQTELEQTLRSLGVETIVLAGVATNIGVESTLRQGSGLGFGFVVAEDACTTPLEGGQEFAMKNIFPRLAKVRSTHDIVRAMRG